MPRHVLDIFLSSTSEDLKPYRTTVTEVLGRLGQFVVRMESFGARPVKPLPACRDEVLRCDALIVVVGHRYGWIPSIADGGDGERSITWWEVTWALAAGKPVYAYLVESGANWTGSREQDRLLTAGSEAESVDVWKAVRGLRAFREFLERSTTRAAFTTPDHLGSLVSTSLFGWLLEHATPAREAGPADTASAPRVSGESQAAPSPRLPVNGQTYWHEQIHAFSARELVDGRPPTRVAIVGGRPRITHPSLAGVALTTAAMRSDGVDIPADDYTTALTALIAGNGTQGFLGVAPGTELLGLSVLDDRYGASNADIALGIDRAVLGGAKVICLSLGATTPSKVIEDAVQDAVDAGATVVCAAGNLGSNVRHYPAAYEPSLAVGAVDATGAPTSWTSYGPWVHVAAPGCDIPVPVGEADYAERSGTSWACGLVTGVAALMVQARPDLTPARLRTILVDTARRPHGVTKSTKVAPTIDAYLAVRRALENG